MSKPFLELPLLSSQERGRFSSSDKFKESESVYLLSTFQNEESTFSEKPSTKGSPYVQAGPEKRLFFSSFSS